MKHFLLFTLLFGTFSTFAQETHRCMTPQAINYQESLTPGYIHSVVSTFNQAKALNAKSNSLYTIPVVVHVVHNTPNQNVHDSVIFDQIRVLNEDYNRLNADTVNMRSDFDIVKGSPKIEFVLAQIDEFGNPTTGITRTATATTTFGSFAVLGGDFSDLEKVKSTANGGQDPWDQSRYLNIWVCNMAIDFFGQEIPAILGYATPPNNLPNWPPGSANGLSDGVVIQYQAFGSNNPVPLDAGGGPIEVLGRTPSHEVGHYLGLRHIWGDGDCTAQDGIDDTPNADAESQQDCDPNKNSCVDNIQGIDLPDMIENYMDYSAESCQNSFTEGQVSLMHGVLEGPRYDLVHGNPASVLEQTTIAWTIAPNPSEGIFKITSDELISEVHVYSIEGTWIRTEIVQNETTILDMSEYASGVYVVSIVSANASANKRVIVQ